MSVPWPIMLNVPGASKPSGGLDLTVSNLARHNNKMQ